jgi:N-acetylmuramoyl-L-alanine amidase
VTVPGRRAARRRHHRRAIAGSVAVVVVALGGGAAYGLLHDRGDQHKESTAARRHTTTSSAATTTQPATPGAPGPTDSQSATLGLSAVVGKTIVIDPGHNGQNGSHPTEINRPIDIGTQTRACDTTGTQTNSGYTESEYDLDVALRMADILRGAGANVVLTRTDNNGWGPCIDERAAIGNRAHADIALSIHADGGPPTGRGFHVIYPPSLPGLTDDIAANSQRLALDVRNAYASGTGMPYADYLGHDGLDVRTDLGGLNLSDVPKVFIETGNMRNATDAPLLTDPGFRQQVAQANATGLADYLAGK